MMYAKELELQSDTTESYYLVMLDYVNDHIKNIILHLERTRVKTIQISVFIFYFLIKKWLALPQPFQIWHSPL